MCKLELHGNSREELLTGLKFGNCPGVVLETFLPACHPFSYASKTSSPQGGSVVECREHAGSAYSIWSPNSSLVCKLQASWKSPRPRTSALNSLHESLLVFMSPESGLFLHETSEHASLVQFYS